MKSLLFTNWTNEDFSHKWNGEPYDFPAGTSILLPQYLAEHFAKHLTDRELQKKGHTVNHFSRPEYLAKAISVGLEAPSPLKMEIEILNSKKEVANESQIVSENKDKPFCTSCDSKGVRHKKECPTIKKTDSEEFAGLTE
jgi:hypothetical protein